MSSLSIFFIFLAIAIFLFYQWAYKYINPYKLYFVMGKKGSGKTSYLCKLALEYNRKGWIVYTNVTDLRVPNVRIINDVGDLGDLVPECNSILLLDEVSLIWDNRHFKNFKDSTKEFFRLQRHYQCVVYLFSQTFDVDKKIRDLSDRMYLSTQFLGRWSLLREIEKKITITESSSESESRVTENLSFRSIFSWRFIYIPKYQPYFESFVLPEHEYLKYDEVPPDRFLEIKENNRLAVRIKRFARKTINRVSEILQNILVKILIKYYKLIQWYNTKFNKSVPIRKYDNLSEFWQKQ